MAGAAQQGALGYVLHQRGVEEECRLRRRVRRTGYPRPLERQSVIAYSTPRPDRHRPAAGRFSQTVNGTRLEPATQGLAYSARGVCERSLLPVCRVLVAPDGG